MIKIKFLHIKNIKNAAWLSEGYCDFSQKEIIINKEIKFRKKIIAIMHELIHYLLYILKLNDNYQFCFDIFWALCRSKNKRQGMRYIYHYFGLYYTNIDYCTDMYKAMKTLITRINLFSRIIKVQAPEIIIQGQINLITEQLNQTKKLLLKNQIVNFLKECKKHVIRRTFATRNI
jgi:hypothetical protein